MKLEEIMNHYGSLKEPFFFLISYDKKDFEVHPLRQLPPYIKYSINENHHPATKQIVEKNPISYEEYLQKFIQIQEHIRAGNTYLINLTSQTTLQTKLNLEEIYSISHGKYKLYYQDQFVCFSPEVFCEIYDNTIYTYPMKGTIDASIHDAQNLIINNQKELAEHTMVVDLLRNDLAMVSTKVKVEKFRYCEEIEAGEKKLIQVSSKISGVLEENWQSKVGNIISTLLPAGSITGTPKKKTTQIIHEVEKYHRGYFTGIFGVFDGQTLQSAVIIRFIEKQHNSLVYKSGGGITCDSNPQEEYQEMLDKVYIP